MTSDAAREVPEREDAEGREGLAPPRPDDPHAFVRHGWRELLAFLPDVARLLARVTKDPRVPWRSKVLATGALAYLVSPLDLLPDAIPVIGQVDDLLVVGLALRHLARAAGYEVLRELWPGSHEGFALMLLVGGVER